MPKLKRYKFSDLYAMSSGISTKPEQAGKGYPFISFSTIFNNYFIPTELPDLMDSSDDDRIKYSVKEGDIFLTRTSETVDELGMSAVAVQGIPNATFSGFAKRLRPLQNDITYHKFMAFYLRSKLFRKTMDNNALMTLRASLNEQIFSYLELLLPDYNTQKKIGDLLFFINSKIELNKKINTELKILAKTMYNYWFVQFDFPNKNGKPYKSSGGKMVFNEELNREIPFNWEVKKISELLPVITGKKDANFATKNGKYNFFTCGEQILKCNEYAFDGKAVLVAGNGNFNIKLYDGKFNAYQRTYVLIPRKKEHYSVIFFSVEDKINLLTNSSRGSIVKFITKGDIEDIAIPLPKSESIYLFSSLNNIIKKLEINIETNQKLEDLRDWLLPMLVNGQVTFKEAEEHINQAAEPQENYS
jgi:type I restriction enzyme S subunit